MSMQMIGRDMFVRITPKSDPAYVQAHRVWDVERFAQCLARDYAIAGKNPATVEVIDEATYRREKKASR